MGLRECLIANLLVRQIHLQLRDRLPGCLLVEALFALAPGLQRRPDLAYLQFERLPEKEFPDTEECPVPPTLAVEVVSKSNTADEIQAKISDYLRNGVELVWVFHPKQQEIYIYDRIQSV